MEKPNTTEFVTTYNLGDAEVNLYRRDSSGSALHIYENDGNKLYNIEGTPFWIPATNFHTLKIVENEGTGDPNEKFCIRINDADNLSVNRVKDLKNELEAASEVIVWMELIAKDMKYVNDMKKFYSKEKK